MARFYTSDAGNYCTYKINGKRRRFKLARYSEREARQITQRIEQLEQSILAATDPPPEVYEWLDRIDDSLRRRLANAGLCSDVEYSVHGLADEWFESRKPNITKGTQAVVVQSVKAIKEFLPHDPDVAEVTESMTREWKTTLEEIYSPETADKRLLYMKAMFGKAVRERVIRNNPMSWFKTRKFPGAKKAHITSERIEKLIKIAPSEEWRMLLAVARYCAVRCPSEIKQMKWSDWDWRNKWITIRSPKTAKYPNGASRQCPLFRKLRPHVAEHEGRTDDEFVFPFLRSTYTLATHFEQWMKGYGLTLWNRPFTSLRSSRIEDLLRLGKQPHVVAKWVGNSAETIWRSYAHCLDSDAADLV